MAFDETTKPADASYAHALRENARMWEERRQEPLGELLHAEAQYSRLQTMYALGDLGAKHRMGELKARIGELIRDADPAAVLQSFPLRRLVLVLYPNGGLKRLEERAASCA